MKHILAIMMIALAGQVVTLSVSAQETARDRINRRNNAQQAGNSTPQLSVRAANMNQSLTQDLNNVRWMREIYRLVDLNKEKNAPLYYPVEPIGDRMNFFTMIFRLLASGSITAYEFQDGKEIFTDQFQIKFKEGLLDRFKILYHEEGGGKYVVDDSDVPSNEVTAYYVKEAWYFDQSNSVVDVKILAICPVMYRQDDFGAVAIPTPLFWLPYENIRPYAARMPIITSSLNNASTGTVDDFFRKRLFQGEIYKTTNMKNQALSQIYPNDTIRKKEQAKIEAQLSQFEKSLWATCAECDSISNLAKKEPVKSASKSARNEKKRTNEPLSDKKSTVQNSSAKQAKTSAPAAPKRSMRNRR